MFKSWITDTLNDYEHHILDQELIIYRPHEVQNEQDQTEGISSTGTSFSDLPNEIIHRIASSSQLTDMMRLSQTSQHLQLLLGDTFKKKSYQFHFRMAQEPGCGNTIIGMILARHRTWLFLQSVLQSRAFASLFKYANIEIGQQVIPWALWPENEGLSTEDIRALEEAFDFIGLSSGAQQMIVHDIQLGNLDRMLQAILLLLPNLEYVEVHASCRPGLSEQFFDFTMAPGAFQNLQHIAIVGTSSASIGHQDTWIRPCDPLRSVIFSRPLVDLQGMCTMFDYRSSTSDPLIRFALRHLDMSIGEIQSLLGSYGHDHVLPENPRSDPMMILRSKVKGMCKNDLSLSFLPSNLDLTTFENLTYLQTDITHLVNVGDLDKTQIVTKLPLGILRSLCIDRIWPEEHSIYLYMNPVIYDNFKHLLELGDGIKLDHLTFIMPDFGGTSDPDLDDGNWSKAKKQESLLTIASANGIVIKVQRDNYPYWLFL